jgi:hypothetical protein
MRDDVTAWQEVDRSRMWVANSVFFYCFFFLGRPSDGVGHNPFHPSFSFLVLLFLSFQIFYFFSFLVLFLTSKIILYLFHPIILSIYLYSLFFSVHFIFLCPTACRYSLVLQFFFSQFRLCIFICYKVRY